MKVMINRDELIKRKVFEESCIKEEKVKRGKDRKEGRKEGRNDRGRKDFL